VHPAVSTRGLKPEDRKELAERVQAIIAAGLSSAGSGSVSG
jgi:hypothetical protein